MTSTFRLIRFSAWAAAAILLTWACTGSGFRDEEGFLRGAFCLPFSAGVALIVMGYGITKNFRGSAFWFSLALAGQAVSLQMIDAGSAIRYQHYKPLGALLSGSDALLLTCFALQTILVAAGLRKHLSEIVAWVGRNFRVWQIAGVALVFLLSSAALSRDVRFYSAELVFAALVQIVNLANILLVALTIPDDVIARLKRVYEKLFERSDTRSSRIDAYSAMMALWVIIVASILSFYSYERHPHIPDEVVYLHHARFLAEGALTKPAPPAPEAFHLYLMEVSGGRWYPSPPPGWPAALAVGVMTGFPWMVNPFLAGINILLAYLLLSEIYDRRAARLALFLLCLSPWHVFMAMNFMTHTFTLTCALVAAVSVIKARKTEKALWGWAGGCAVGVASLIRPLEGLLLGALIGLWVIGVGGRRLKASAIAAFILGVVITGGIVLPYNKALTGQATLFPLNAYLNKEFGPGRNDLGFGPDRGLGWALQPFPGHTPLGSLVNANLNIFSLNIETLGWSIGSLLLVALLVLCAKKHKSDYLMLGVIAAVFGVYIFYWYSGGPDFGARYWYLMLVPLIALTVRGIEFLQSRLNFSAHSGARVSAAVVLLCCSTLVNYFPWRAIDKYHHYLYMRPDIRHLAQEYNFGRSLVLIRGNEHPDYASAAVYNPLDTAADAPVYVWDRSPDARSQALEAYRDRPVWIVEGHSITGRGFKVVGGPLSAQELLARSVANGDVLNNVSGKPQ